MKRCKHMSTRGICTNVNALTYICKRPCSYYETCQYNTEIPDVGLCCGAYHKAKRNDGKHWMHFPFCSEDDCPLKHPELLKGAKLESEE